MKTRNTISSLSIAAIALLIAALPAMAQAQSSQNRRDTARLLAAPGSGVTLALNWKAVPANSAKPAALPVEASSFTNSSLVTRMNDTINAASQMKIYDANDFDLKNQFRGQTDTQSKRSRVTFVPSRGPWDMK